MRLRAASKHARIRKTTRPSATPAAFPNGAPASLLHVDLGASSSRYRIPSIPSVVALRHYWIDTRLMRVTSQGMKARGFVSPGPLFRAASEGDQRANQIELHVRRARSGRRCGLKYALQLLRRYRRVSDMAGCFEAFCYRLAKAEYIVITVTDRRLSRYWYAGNAAFPVTPRRAETVP